MGNPRHPRAPRRLFRLPWRTASQIRADVEAELTFHLDARVEALVASGSALSEARAQALREFGSVDDARRSIAAIDHEIEAANQRREWSRDLWYDVRYALRKLRAAPAFSLAVTATFALGIGANTAVFSVVNGTILQPLPFPEADHLVRIRFTQHGEGDASTPPDLSDYRTQATLFDGFAAFEVMTANLTRDGAEPERLQGAQVSANWFSLLRVRPVVGRFFSPAEDSVGAPNVVILGEGVWRRDFGADPRLIGRTVRVNAEPYTVIGVAPAAAHYPLLADAWLAERFTAQKMSDAVRGARWLGLLARVKGGVSLERADAEAEHISERMEQRFPEQYRDRRAHLVQLQTFLVGSLTRPLWIILGAVALVLLIACANVANLMLVRGAARDGEFAIRTVLGAGTGRLARQLITESALLSLLGAAAGVGLAAVAIRFLLGQAPSSIVVVAHATIDRVTLALAALVTLATSVVFGMLPVSGLARARLADSIRAGGRGAGGQSSHHRTKRLIVVAEVALAVMLATAAGLLLRSFTRLLAVDPGFRPSQVFTAKLLLPHKRYDSANKWRLFARELESRLRAIPGARRVALADYIPLDGASYDFSFTIRGRPPIRLSDEPSAQVRVVTPGFFEALDIPLVSGRPFMTADRPGAEPVAIITRAFATRFFASENPIGQSLRLGWGENDRDSTERNLRIVGVAGDVKGRGLDNAPDPTIYVPLDQKPDDGLSILVQSPLPAVSVAAAVKDVVHAMDADVPIFSVQTMDERIEGSIGPQRFYATLIAAFAAIALLLAAVGLYGVIAYAVAERTHELGVRVALGATPLGIVRMVVREGLVLATIGASIGVVASLLIGGTMSTMLFGVTPRDPLTLAGVVVLLAAVTMVASWLPARRAARADPLRAIRGE